VLFVPEFHVVLVHCDRAEHIVRAPGVYEQKPASMAPRPAPVRPRAPSPAPFLAVETKAGSCAPGGFLEGRCLRMADYVTVRRPADGAPAAGGC